MLFSWQRIFHLLTELQDGRNPANKSKSRLLGIQRLCRKKILIQVFGLLKKDAEVRHVCGCWLHIYTQDEFICQSAFVHRKPHTDRCIVPSSWADAINQLAEVVFEMFLLHLFKKLCEPSKSMTVLLLKVQKYSVKQITNPPKMAELFNHSVPLDDSLLFFSCKCIIYWIQFHTEHFALPHCLLLGNCD